ncbi:conserved hypothetical protein [Neospora caninum Liverpool]|uniref:N-acetyltransferase B complex (NatB) non catalytic subunit n=1 Tax=Neospora caninum (strain Liverpool) TaxID=572307 RepID=F0VF49_NEOCL|nr:conserved hypothetical protein [Neospora caninum Liverpool]CBZ52343.1 conserved hypothetical protein [Neospora caninum Liverpool]CEL66312.1 TPA: hypothetical protein BN1204_021310 [Neospora caninum Liverpool]|eukprot:XP_003882375.1 conserved hypothetical protein [Neospora caninum Liverpool]
MAAAARKARDQIRAALDEGENKQAARMAAQHLLKKSKGVPDDVSAFALKALRAIALARDGQERDAVGLAREVERAVEKDDETARLCSVAFKELREIYYLPPSRIDARRYPPLEETEEVTAFLDSLAASTTGHLERLLPSALRLFSRFKKPRYLQWALVCMLLHDASPGSKATWALAAKLLAKLPALDASPSTDSHFSPQLMSNPEGCCERRDSYARFILTLSVLRQNGQCGEGLGLLAAHTDLCLVPLEGLALRLQLLLEDGRLLEAFQVSEQMLDEQPFNTSFAENCIRLGLSLQTENAEKGTDSLAPWKEKWEAEKRTSFEATQALLSLHRLRALRPLCASLSDKAWTDARLDQLWTDPARSACISDILSALTAHAHDSRCFSTLRCLLGCFPLSMREVCLSALEPLHGPWQGEVEKHLAMSSAQIAGCSQSSEGGFGFLALLGRLAFRSPLGRYKVVAPSGAAAINAWLQLRADLDSVAPELSDTADDLLLLAVDVLLLFDHHLCRLENTEAGRSGEATVEPPVEPLAERRFFFAALTLLSSAIASRNASPSSSSPSPASAHASPAFRALLLWLAGCVGLVSTSRSLFFSSLDIKNAMLFSLGFSLALPLADYGASADVLSLSKMIQDGHEENVNSLSDALIASFEEGTYAGIAEFLFIRPFTSSSLFTSLVDLDALLYQPVAAPAAPASAVSLHQFSYFLACRENRAFTASPVSLSAQLLLFSAARRTARAGATGYSADLTSLALSQMSSEGDEADPKSARLGVLPLDKETLVLNLSLPPFSASRVRHLSDPIQRSLSRLQAMPPRREGTEGGATDRETAHASDQVPFSQAAENLERAVAASQTLATPWTPVAPARLVGAESLEALPRCRSADFFGLLQSLSASSSSAERRDSHSPTVEGRGEGRTCGDSEGAEAGGKAESEAPSMREGDSEDQLLRSLYGTDWADETTATGNAIGGGSTFRASKATEVMTRHVEGIPKRTRLRRLTLLTLLPPSAFPSPGSLSAICHHLREELSELGSAPTSRSPDGPSSALSCSASDSSSPPSSSMSGAPACWPSLGAALPTACAVHGGGASRPSRSGAALLIRVWRDAVDMLDASQDFHRHSGTARKHSESNAKDDAVADPGGFLVSLDRFVRDASVLFTATLRSLRLGFAAFLDARFGKLRRDAFERETAKEQRKKEPCPDGGERATGDAEGREECVLPIWDAFYLLASFTTLALVTAAAAARNVLSTLGSRKEGERLRQAILKRIALLLVDLEEVQAEVRTAVVSSSQPFVRANIGTIKRGETERMKQIARAAGDLSDEERIDEGEAGMQPLAWWTNIHVTPRGSQEVLRFPFTETPAFGGERKALASRRQWLLEAASSNADVGSG